MALVATAFIATAFIATALVATALVAAKAMVFDSSARDQVLAAKVHLSRRLDRGPHRVQTSRGNKPERLPATSIITMPTSSELASLVLNEPLYPAMTLFGLSVAFVVARTHTPLVEYYKRFRPSSCRPRRARCSTALPWCRTTSTFLVGAHVTVLVLPALILLALSPALDAPSTARSTSART